LFTSSPHDLVERIPVAGEGNVALVTVTGNLKRGRSLFGIRVIPKRLDISAGQVAVFRVDDSRSYA
jgi:hypothetical protein